MGEGERGGGFSSGSQLLSSRNFPPLKAAGNVRDLPRQRGVTPMGSHARRSAEVADIFIPLTRNENSAMTVGGMLFFGLCFPAGAGVDRSGRGYNPRPARDRRGSLGTTGGRLKGGELKGGEK